MLVALLPVCVRILPSLKSQANKTCSQNSSWFQVLSGSSKLARHSLATAKQASKSLGRSLILSKYNFFRTCYRSYCCLSTKAYNILLELPLPLLLLYPLRRVRVCETDVLAGPEAVSTTTSSSILIVVVVIIIISIISSSFYPLNFLSLIFPSKTHIQHNFMLTIITTTTTTTLTAPIISALQE